MRGRIFNARIFGICLTFGFSAAMAVIPNTISFVKAFGGTSFARPVFFAQIPGKDSNYVVLEQQAGNAIVVHRKALAGIDRLVDSAPLGELALKGFPQPVEAVNVLAVRSGFNEISLN